MIFMSVFDMTWFRAIQPDSQLEKKSDSNFMYVHEEIGFSQWVRSEMRIER